MIRKLLAQLSTRMHTIDAIHARQQELAENLSALREEMQLLSQSIEAQNTLLKGYDQQAQQRHETSIQAEIESRAHLKGYLVSLLEKMDMARLAQGRTEARENAKLPSGNWEEHAFSVYSQFGEDGMLQHLIQQVPLPQKTFIEFGVEDYRQANTRFLIEKDRWKGLVLEGDLDCVKRLQGDPIYFWRDLTVVQAFITTENINALLTDAGFGGEIGLLSIDIDGNDYWIWEAIESVNPRLVSVEYNFRFGPDHAVTIPYKPDFTKNAAHPSHIYYGSSLRALAGLAHKKGYDLVGCSDGGVNAFFVRRDCRPAALPRLTVAEAYRAGQHLEFYSPTETAHPFGVVRKTRDEQMELLLSLPLVDFPEYLTDDL